MKVLCAIAGAMIGLLMIMLFAVVARAFGLSLTWMLGGSLVGIFAVIGRSLA